MLKNCRNCSVQFEATQKQKLCPKCRSKARAHKYDIIERSVICKECGKELYKESLKKTFKTLKTRIGPHCKSCLENKYKIKRPVICRKCENILYYEEIKKTKDKRIRYYRKSNKYCKECLKIALKNKAKSSRKNWQDYSDKIRKGILKHKISENARNKISSNMKKNNPMFNSKTVDKVKATLNFKINNNEIVYKKGHKHHLYEGNKNFNSNIRKWLYKPWGFKILERDNFKCIICSSNKNLHVHHNRPLRDIINIVLIRNNIKYPDLLKENNIKLYEQLINEVIIEHKLEDGITVCKKCHKKIDKQYRVKKVV